MRLHRLEITAFGPFAGCETVDFDALTDAGLFLLHGPTGAGKTTVLDAVCFALFGVVPGARQQAGRFRSDHAAPDTATRVVLEVSLRGRRLRVTRSPGWERPKRRGLGTTREQPRVLLEELRPDQPPQVLSTRLDETGQFVRDAVGMTAEQFCQVVLLPQGRFADVLRASSEECRWMLEQLFGTARFSSVESWLAARRREARAELVDAEGAVASVASRICEAAGLPSAERPGDDDELAGWTAGLLVAATGRADAAERARVAAEHRLAAAHQEVEAATRLADQQQRVHDAREGAARVRDADGDRARWRAELAAARRAAALAPALEDLHGAGQAATERDNAEAHARAQLPAGLAAASAAALRESGQRVRAELVLLERATDDVRVEEHLAQQLRDLQAAADAAARAERVEREVIDQTPPLLLELERGIERARLAESERVRLTGEAAVLAERLGAARRRDELLGEEAELVERLSGATDEAQRRRGHWLDLRERRLDGMAAELACGLGDGTACPVCGSVEHPAPAAAGADAVSRAEEEDAQEAFRDAEAECGCVADELAALRSALAAAQAAAGDLPLDELRHRHGATSAALSETSRDAGRLPDLVSRHEVVQERLGESRARLDEQREKRIAAQTAASAVSERRADLVHRIRAACGPDASVTARRRRLIGLAGALDAAVEAVEEAMRGRLAHRAAADDVTERCRGAGFPDIDAAQLAVRDEAAVARLDSRLEDLAAQERSIAETLADPALTAAAAQAPADPARARRAVTEARDALTRAAGGASTSGATVRRLELLTVDLAQQLGRLAPVRTWHDLVERLSTLAEGTSSDNTLRMRLSAYVLAARLEQVAAAASQRLLRMSGGRYSLVHTDESSGGRSRAGLGLRVCDAWTGLRREPATLSGGETFVASLALALGLADVVTAEAGGISLDTLYVDEGFGSLDDEALEEVLDVLDGLRAGGRAVGVVSHVGDLQSRIPAQLHVRKARNGSTLAGPAPEGSTAAILERSGRPTRTDDPTGAVA